MASDTVKGKSVIDEKFDFWKSEIKRYIELLGLKNWEIFIMKPEQLEGDRALTYRQPEGRIAEFHVDEEFLATRNQGEISICAAHEVLHVLLAPMYYLGTKSNLPEEQLSAIEHDVIRTLERII